MLFHSLAYATLMLLTLTLCVLLPPQRRWLVLLLASFSFYLAWRPEYLLLLLVTASTCHFAAIQVGHFKTSSMRRNSLLLGVIILNLGILFLFKYYALFADSLNAFTQVGLPSNLDVLLPVGISFYTFQAMGYVIDVHQGKLKPEQSLARTTLFISFFPQLVAGPIERASRLLPALSAPVYFRWRNIRLGSWLILWGLFKKVVLADRLSLLVDHAYSTPDAASGWLLLAATYAFAFQIYCDFSGYSDMAIGSARLFGIDLMRNFRIPYVATSLNDFWKRWHISLSTWFRDYLYIPLGGNRAGIARWIINVLIVFGISGLWHGAEWTFVVWGLIHGSILIAEAAFTRLRGAKTSRATRLSKGLQIAITFHIVLLTWIFFRADNLPEAMTIVEKALMPGLPTSTDFPDVFSKFECAITLVAMTWMMAIEIPHQGNAGRIIGLRPRVVSRLIILGTLLLVMNFGIFNHPNQFVYFQF